MRNTLIFLIALFILCDHNVLMADNNTLRTDTIGDFITSISPYNKSRKRVTDGDKYPESKDPFTCESYPKEVYTERNFDQGWSFSDDSSVWKSVSLPHDFIIERNYDGKGGVGPFLYGIKDSVSTGSIPGGTGWYKKTFVTQGNSYPEYLSIRFDGVMELSDVWINGHHLGKHYNGYTPIEYDLTPYLNRNNHENTIIVKAVNPSDNSRWYAGGGIYRHVYVKPSGIVSSPKNDIKITSDIKGNSAKVYTIVPVNNKGEATDVSVSLRLLDSDGKQVATADTIVKINERSISECLLSADIIKPFLWSTDSPSMYKAVIEIKKNGKTSDYVEQPFGIRSISFTAESGFLLNGKSIIIKGGCLHHDNGILGAAAHDEAEYRKILIMKRNGFNAIRTSHNPPSEALLDACDRLGMLVLDEVFDFFENGKRDNDYHLYFKENHLSDLTSWIKRDRNHPSVIMWSIGNEVPDRSSEMGLRTAKELVEAIKTLDNTRPVTQAVCTSYDKEKNEWEDTDQVTDMLDVTAYNYVYDKYEYEHDRHPDKAIIGTESFPAKALENYRMSKKHPYVTGDFVWTGMDYIGEVGIGNYSYTDDMEKLLSTPVRAWPWYVSNCGDIDLIGDKKPQSYYRDVVWGDSDLELLAQPEAPEGQREIISKWGWRNELPSWNWNGQEGKTMTVRAYSDCDSVRLYLNGKLVSTERTDTSLTATFRLRYTPGVIRAEGIKEGQISAVKELHTTGNTNRIRIHTEDGKKTVPTDRLVFARVELIDEEGRPVSTDDREITISVEGKGELIATGNAAPDDMKSFRNPKFMTYRGKALIIIKTKTDGGRIKIKAHSPNLPDAELVLHTK